MALEHDKWLPQHLRDQAVNHFLDVIAEDTLEEIRALYKQNPDDWMVPHHFFAGMQFRNILRKAIKDDELPPVDYGDGKYCRNWDDYYVRVVEEAAGCYGDS